MSSGPGKTFLQREPARESGQEVKTGFFARLTMSFSTKVLVCVLGLMILSTVTMNLFYLHSQQKTFTQEIDNDGRLMAGILATNTRLGIFAKDRRLLAASLDPVFTMEGVVGACVYSAAGELMKRKTGPGWEDGDICRIPEILTDDLSAPGGTAPEIVRHEGPRTIDFWSPVIAGPSGYTEEALFFGSEGDNRATIRRTIGFVGVVFDKGPVRKRIQEILIKNLIILFLFLIIGFAAAYYLIQGVSRPLNHLVSDIRAHGPTAGSRDELGLLADTFSGMINTIGDSFATINELRQGLERKVGELELEVGRRRQTEADLRESEEKFRSISENIADGVVIIVDNEFAWYNKAFSSIFSIGDRERPALEAPLLLPPDDQAPASRSVPAAPEWYKVEARKKNGDRLLLEVNARKIMYERQDAIQVIIRDRTEADRIEQERKELEVKALSQSKLASLGKIATGVAHEINQPLSYIKISYESALQDMENDRFDQQEMKGFFSEALRQVDRITKITEHLRSFGRTDTSLFAQIRLSEVLDNSLTLMHEIMRIAGIDFIRDIDQDLPTIRGNSIQLEQVFINLLQNSVDAMADCSDKQVTVTMHRAGEGVEIIFSDTGPGVPADVREIMFEPFFTTKRLEDRTGLGLAIVSTIIREHDGLIEYRERQNGGAAFVMSLPRYTNGSSSEAVAAKGE